MSNTDSNHRHPLQSYWQLAGAAVQADALSRALDLGPFDALPEPLAPASPAPRLGPVPAHTCHSL